MLPIIYLFKIVSDNMLKYLLLFSKTFLLLKLRNDIYSSCNIVFAVSKIKDETGVQITIPNENTNSDEIVVEGKKDGVARAVAEIKQIVAKIVSMTFK